jgi:hypothetical protein
MTIDDPRFTLPEQWAYAQAARYLPPAEHATWAALPLMQQLYRLGTLAHAKRQYHLRDCCTSAARKLR